MCICGGLFLLSVSVVMLLVSECMATENVAYVSLRAAGVVGDLKTDVGVAA